MSRYLIDSDAFLALRSLGLLQTLCAALDPLEPLLMMGHPARNELNVLQREVDALVAAGRLAIHEFTAKSPDGVRFKALRRAGVDKGEAEAIAWLLESCEPAARPLFVSVDVGARKHAAANKVVALDVMGAIVEWVESGLLDRAAAKKALAVWDDKGQERGRPNDYAGFDHTYAKRLVARGFEGPAIVSEAPMTVARLLKVLGVKDTSISDLEGKLDALLAQLVTIGEAARVWLAGLDEPTRELISQLARTLPSSASHSVNLDWLTTSSVSAPLPVAPTTEQVASLEAQVNDINEQLKISTERSIIDAFPPKAPKVAG